VKGLREKIVQRLREKIVKGLREKIVGGLRLTFEILFRLKQRGGNCEVKKSSRTYKNPAARTLNR
jgi:hypothetical protein